MMIQAEKRQSAAPQVDEARKLLSDFANDKLLKDMRDLSASIGAVPRIVSPPAYCVTFNAG